MIKCPSCKGNPITKTWGPHPWSNEDPDAPDAGQWTEHKCMYCGGSGEVTPLKKSLWDAGYRPSSVARGFA